LTLFRGSFEFEFELFFAFYLGHHLSWNLLALQFFLLLHDLLQLLVFQLCFMCLGFKIQTLYFCVVNVLIKEEIEKPSGQYLGLIYDE
jgi:hypothetical protein